jgi:glutamyl-tRNA(Gln) amidotransferase subunit E
MLPPFKPFDEMTAEDYASIGFKVGLEVHQQLLTRRKLFCRCPAGGYSSQYDAEILRHMRPTLSELGEYDGTALMEKKTRKNIYYRIHHETVCTYEFDDTPPFPIDDEAVDIALGICMLLRLTIVGELHIARKQYLDGSIPTGFQRTGILGVDGWIPYRDRRIGVRQLSIEEDSCREVSDIGHDRVYLTDRLGTPLVETVTEPDMRTPREAAEVCQIIRMLYRSTGQVRTGYGATRQDVNVSVRGGTRIEIKGVPRIPRIPRLVYNEALRQWSLLHIRDELHRRGVTPGAFRWTRHDVTRSVGRVGYQPVRAALGEGLRVKCVVLHGFAGLLNHPTQENTTFSKEFSDRVRVVACLTTLPNIVHSDSAADALAARDWKELRRKTAAGEGDALILVWGTDADTECACEEIAIRAREATEGIPHDTRQALSDGTNGFERVLPGPQRMYPDTDLPPEPLTRERVGRIAARVPEFVWERAARYRALGVPEDTVNALSISPRAALFDRVIGELEVDPRLAAVVLVQRLKALHREGAPLTHVPDGELFHLFHAVAEGRLCREGIVPVLRRMASVQGPFTTQYDAADLREIIEDFASGRAAVPASPAEEPEALVCSVVEAADATAFTSTAQLHRYLMGVLMRRVIGRVPGRTLSEHLHRHLQARGTTVGTRRATA